MTEEAVDPAQFYTGLVARLYAPLRSAAPDPEPYAAFLAFSGEPALELGCGDGDPILALRERGLDIEGLDSSADMLARCRAAAAERGIEVVLHEAAIEAMDLGKRYRSIYLAGPTFNLIVDDATALAALERIRAHLEPEGKALIPLFVPEPLPHAGVAPREHLEPDGAVLRFTTLGEHRDDVARRQDVSVRYELESGSEVSAVDRTWVLHWHTQEGFAALVDQAGLRVHAVLSPEGGRAGPDDASFVFLVGPA